MWSKECAPVGLNFTNHVINSTSCKFIKEFASCGTWKRQYVRGVWCGNTEKVCCLAQRCLAVNLNVSQSHRQLSFDHNPPSVIVCQLFQVRTVGTCGILIDLYFAKLWFPLVDMHGRMISSVLVVTAEVLICLLCIWTFEETTSYAAHPAGMHALQHFIEPLSCASNMPRQFPLTLNF